jgi:hypothetical protein
MITSGNYEEGTGPKRVLMLGAAVLVCAPMVLSLLLLLAVVWPRMDAVTRHMPKAVRSMVASGLLEIHDGPATPLQLQRAKHLDAEAAARYRPPVFWLSAARTPPDMQEMYRQQRETKQAAKELVQKAAALEKAGRECDAEELYTRAASKDSSSEVYEYTEGMGRAGLKCGDLTGARAGLEVAVIKEKNFIKGTDADQLTDVRRDLLKDREFLIVVYQRQHEDVAAADVCSEAHKGWKGCSCALAKGGDVTCTERR